MRKLQYQSGLFITSIIVLFWIVIVELLWHKEQLLYFNMVTAALFLSYTWILHKMSLKSLHVGKSTRFIHVVMANSFVKMILTFTLVGLFYYLKKPETFFFLISFIALYAIFTIFETWYLLQISDAQAGKKMPEKDKR